MSTRLARTKANARRTYSEWAVLSATINSYAGGYALYDFLATGTVTVLRAGYVLYDGLGGGGGGSGGQSGINYGSGGGGGVKRSAKIWLAAGSYPITIGAGGAGAAGQASDGAATIFAGIAAPGGLGAPNGRTGGANADFAGGTNSGTSDSGGGAGGGGVGGATGIGGPGALWPDGVTYGGGGGGVEGGVGQPGSNGGASGSITSGTAASANTGGGGGGGPSGGGGAGGSGRACLRVPAADPNAGTSIEIIGTATTTGNTNATNAGVIDVPAGAAVGDTLICTVMSNDTNPTGMTGFTGASLIINAAGANGVKGAVFALKLAGAPPASYTIQVGASPATCAWNATMICFRNVHASPLSGTPNAPAPQTGATPFGGLTMTPAHAAAMAVAVGGCANTNMAVSNAQSFTQQANRDQTASSLNCEIFLHTKPNAGTSLVTFPTYTQGNANFHNEIAFALRPAAS